WAAAERSRERTPTVNPANRKFGPTVIPQQRADVPKHGSCRDNSGPRNCPRRDSRHATAETHLPSPIRLTLPYSAIRDTAGNPGRGSRDDLHSLRRPGVRSPKPDGYKWDRSQKLFLAENL